MYSISLLVELSTILVLLSTFVTVFEVSTLVVSETVSILVSDLFTFRVEQEHKQTVKIIAIINIMMLLSFLFGVVVIIIILLKNH
jgi:hypothetical protein